jgi:tripartite-type tricarboxylate transporter receptor subunit TctC
VKLILRVALLTMAVFALGGIGNLASADPYPAKPIRFVAPYPPGSVTDLLARIIAQKLTEKWGQPVIVENRGGGGSVIGTDVVAKAPPDGYSILMVAPDLAINESLRSKLPYDAEKSFAPVTLLVSAPMVLSVHSSLAVSNVKELVAYAKAHPGQLSYASGGNGTVAHLGMELFKHMAGVDIVHVPYKGTAAVVKALITGEVQTSFAQMATVRPQIAGGKLRVLAVATASRAQAMPDLPTVAEAGVPEFKADVWFGVVAPAGTPGEIIAKLNQELVAVMRMPRRNARRDRAHTRCARARALAQGGDRGHFGGRLEAVRCAPDRDGRAHGSRAAGCAVARRRRVQPCRHRHRALRAAPRARRPVRPGRGAPPGERLVCAHDLAPCLCQRDAACGLRRRPARSRLRSTRRDCGQAVIAILPKWALARICLSGATAAASGQPRSIVNSHVRR